MPVKNVLDGLGGFDAMFCYTFRLNEAGPAEQIGESTTSADHFFLRAAAGLFDSGVITCLSNEVDLPSRQHRRLLSRHFRSGQSTVPATSPE